MENVTGIFVTFLTATVPLALLTERVTAGIRLVFNRNKNAEEVNNAGNPLWIAAPFVIGLALCIGWQYNFVGPLARGVPALSNSSTFDGVAGQVLTGLFVGALAGPLHEKIDEWNARKKANRAIASGPGTLLASEAVVK